MHIDELDYPLPLDLIADRPVEPRDACRLMVIHRKTGIIEHRTFRDLKNYLQAGDAMVLNTARVVPARLFAHIQRKPDQDIEILMLDVEKGKVMLSFSRKIKPDDVLVTKQTETEILVVEREGEFWNLKIKDSKFTWNELLNKEGHIPLPPYILNKRSVKSDIPEDRVWYQTTFADRGGAVAAPTAGLHFSNDMLEDLKKSGVEIAPIFLKVGAGTFQPIRTSILEEHQLLPEEYELGEESARKIEQAVEKKKRIVAVGTTSLRALEAIFKTHGKIRKDIGATDIFVMPGYVFRSVDVLITNFHLPKTTLLALVYAFAGKDLMKKAYEMAVLEKYRFFSYGDAMLIL